MGIRNDVLQMVPEVGESWIIKKHKAVKNSAFRVHIAGELL